MAVIQARKNKKEKTYQVLIRARDGHPYISRPGS